MTRIPTAFMPLTSYPDVAPDDAIRAAVRLAASLGMALQATTFAVEIPQIVSPLGGLFLDVPEMVRAAEEKSRVNSARLRALVAAEAGQPHSGSAVRTVILGAELESAAAEARAYDVAVIAWSGAEGIVRELAQAVIFGSGRPAILVPSSGPAALLNHVAIGWDGSTVAARALWDALALLPEGGRLSVLTVGDEKPLAGPDLAAGLATSLKARGIEATAVNLTLSGRSIADTLQEAALTCGAGMLAMGGFGHSRVRDFILGGATRGVLSDLRLPILLSH